jgi:hypothetical protein
MDTGLFALRKTKYRPVHGLLNRKITLSSFDRLEPDLLAAVADHVPVGFRLTSSLKNLEIMLAKYGFLDLEFVTARDLLTSADRIHRNAIRELGYSPRPTTAGKGKSGDRSCLEALMESIKEDTTYLRIFLNTAWSNDAIPRIIKELRRQQSGKTMSFEGHAAAFASAISAIAETIKKSFPITFTIEDACLTNSDAIWLAKHVYL